MPQVLKPQCLIHFWVNPFFSFPVWIPQVLKPLCLIHFWVNPFFSFPTPAASFLPLSGVIRNGSPQYKGQEGGKFMWQNQFSRLQMVQFECARYWNPCVFCVNPFFPFSKLLRMEPWTARARSLDALQKSDFIYSRQEGEWDSTHSTSTRGRCHRCSKLNCHTTINKNSKKICLKKFNFCRRFNRGKMFFNHVQMSTFDHFLFP